MALLADVFRWTPVPALVLVANVICWLANRNPSSAKFTSVMSSTGPPPAALLPSSSVPN
jgi:hypothetical protein